MDGTAEDSVGEGIDRLEERFGSFPVNQTTLTLPESEYERLREREDGGIVDVYVHVRNDDGDVLHVCDGDELTVPWCVSDPGESFSGRVREAVRDATGVACRLDDVSRATIAGVRPEGDDREAVVYRLIVLVDAVRERGTADGAVWSGDDPAIPEYV